MSAVPDSCKILDLLDDCVISWKLDGRVTSWNRAAEKVYGIARQQALGLSLGTLFERPAKDSGRRGHHDPMAVSEWSGTIDRVVTGTSRPVRVSVARKLQRDDDGKPVTVVETSRPVVLTESRVRNDDLVRLLAATGAAVIPVDVTAVTRIFASLGSRHKQNYRDYLRNEPALVLQMMHAAKVMAAEISPKGRLPESLSAIGRAGRDLSSFWPLESADAFVDTIVSVLVDGCQVRSSCRLLCEEGRPFEAEVAAVPATSDGDGVHLLLAVRDVSPEREAVALIEASELRYRYLFEYMPIALTQVDASGLVEVFGALRKQGVTDLSAYIDAHPEFMDVAMERMLVEQVNQASADLFAATSREDMRGPIARYWDAGLPTLRKSLEARYRGEEFFQEEAKMRRLDGGVVDVLYAAARHGSLPNKSLVAFMDISDRKQAEHELRRSERRYQDLFQAMTVSFWELDLTTIDDLLDRLRPGTDGNFAEYLKDYPDCVATILQAARIVDVNDQTLTLFGGTEKADLLGTLDHFWSPDRWIDGAAAVLTVLKKDASVTIETRLRRLDGVEFDAQFTLWFSTDDRRRGLAAVTDISERVNAFIQLEQSEQRFRDLFQHLPVPVLQVNSKDLQTRLQALKDQGVDDLAEYLADNPDLVWAAMDSTVIEEANDAALKVLGASANEIRGPITPLWRDHPEVYTRLLQNRYLDLAAYEEEVTLTTFDGRIREGMLTVTFPSALARLGVTINAFVDTTEKKQAERKLRQIEADYAHAARISMLGELTASIAHEVNQPLAAITTYGEAGLRWLSRPKPEISEVRDIVTRIVADAQRAASVIARVRTMASHRTQDMEMVPVDDLVAEAVLFLRHEFQSQNVKVAHLPATVSARVNVDRIQIQQVIVNMAVNAVQAISATNANSREVLLRTTREGPNVRCSVEDSGPGIAMDQSNQIFESFVTTKRGGMGMGLPISRSIIEAHGGRMTADNESPLGGARFSFILPALP